MASKNIYSFLQARQRGGRRPRLCGAQLKMLRMQPRWSFPDALPETSKLVKDVVLLSQDAFCLVTSQGRADAIFVDASDVERTEAPQLHWLTDLRIFGEERVKMVMHLRACKALLVVFSIAGDDARGTLYVRAIDVPSILRGEVRVRSCGELASIAVPVGGFVEVDEQNQNVVVFDGTYLRCWGTQNFEPRVVLGPWSPHCAPNVRFTLGHMALLRLTDSNVVEIALHAGQDGYLEFRREIEHGPLDKPFVFLELCNNMVLLKREESDIAVVDALSHAAPHIVVGTRDWDPDLFVFLPARSLVLASFGQSLEIWRCPRPSEFARVGSVNLLDFRPGLFCIDEWTASALAVKLSARGPAIRHELLGLAGHDPSPPTAQSLAFASALFGDRATTEHHALVLLDMFSEGSVCSALQDACERVCGAGIARFVFDLDQGVLLLVSNNGGLFSYGLRDRSVDHAMVF